MKISILTTSVLFISSLTDAFNLQRRLFVKATSTTPFLLNVEKNNTQHRLPFLLNDKNHNDVQDINSLSNLNFVGTDKKVCDTLTDLIAKLGENIVIKKFIKLSDKTQKFQKYLHNSVNENSGKIGVLLSYDCNELNDKVSDFSKNLCMQIAATNPKSVDRKNLDPELVEKEEVIFREQLNNSGKPDEIINKIVEGKINKFYEEVCLDEQIFVMDGKIKINKLISNFNDENSFNFRIINFYIFKLGQE